MFIVITYDINDDKKRTRLHKTLRRYGEAVQYSVFECIIDEAQFDEMRREIARLLGDEAQGVRLRSLRRVPPSDGNDGLCHDDFDQAVLYYLSRSQLETFSREQSQNQQALLSTFTRRLSKPTGKEQFG